jgi:transcriptional regulator with GAF, ATPase, and Fis domain
MRKPVNWREVVVNSLYLRDKGVCGLCENPIHEWHIFEIDHIIEKENDGLDIIENLRLVHVQCHKGRHQKKRIIIHKEVINKLIPNKIVVPPSGLSMEDTQKHLINQALTACNGNQSAAAISLGLTRAKFRVLLQRAKRQKRAETI